MPDDIMKDLQAAIDALPPRPVAIADLIECSPRVAHELRRQVPRKPTEDNLIPVLSALAIAIRPNPHLQDSTIVARREGKIIGIWHKGFYTDATALEFKPKGDDPIDRDVADFVLFGRGPDAS